MSVNLIAAVRAAILADSVTNSVVSGRVFGGELPPGQTKSMPRACIIVKHGGGSEMIGRGADYSNPLIDVLCYGETPTAADSVRQAIHPYIKHITRQVFAGVLIHSVIPTGGPLSMRDGDADWPYVFTAWQINSAEVPMP